MHTSRRLSPQVTGISPKEGSPGTRVTIRGEHLGVDARDLIGLNICGVDCLLSAEWKSANKIIARTGQAKGTGDIIVATRSGGIGSTTVQFRGYNIQIGPLQESAVWIDESTTCGAVFGRVRAASPIVSQDWDDPLGISDEASDKKISEEELQELFPEASGNTDLDNFEPAWFLLQNHHGTSFDDLKTGLSNLRRKAQQQNEGPLAFAKTNLTAFLDCYDMLTEMYSKITADKAKSHGLSATALLEETLQKANKAAESVFDDVLGRKDRADATRNALSVLNRFKLLFYLPNTIERNIDKGDYDLVITDYTRAKSLFWVTEVQAFKKVYSEVENRIAAFRKMLYEKLMLMPSSPDEQKKLIRYLVHLEVQGDPAWECLVNMQKWLLKLMHQCQSEHIDKEEEEERDQLRVHMMSPSKNVLQTPGFKSGAKPPQRVSFVETLTKILCDNVPDFWRLGQSYLSGKLLKEMKKTAKADASKQAQFKQMLHDVIELYTSLLRGAYLPGSLMRLEPRHIGHSESPRTAWRDHKQDSHLAWLPLCVRQVRSCTALMVSLELPGESVVVLQTLAFDLRWSSLTTLLKQAIQDTKNLQERETWSIDTDDERGGTTTLPTLFENIVSEMLHTLQEVVSARHGEKQLFADSINQKVASELSVELLQTFAITLERLALIDDKASKKLSVARDLFSQTHTEGVPLLDKRLIIVLNNCALTVDHVLPRLVDGFDKHGYPDIPRVQMLARKAYRDVDARLFDKYVEEKAGPVIGALEQNMYVGMFDWSSTYHVTGVRSYIKESVMSLLEVHAEVYSIGPTFVERVMCRIVEQVAEEICRLFQCVAKFSPSSAVQAKVDISAFDRAAGAYKTPRTRLAIKEALNCLSAPFSPADNKKVDDHLEKFSKQMHFQLMCFRVDKR